MMAEDCDDYLNKIEGTSFSAFINGSNLLKLLFDFFKKIQSHNFFEK